MTLFLPVETLMHANLHSKRRGSVPHEELTRTYGNASSQTRWVGANATSEVMPRQLASAHLPASSYWSKGAKIFTNAWDKDGNLGRGDASGVEVRINGVSWSGFESRPCVLGGLEAHDVLDYLRLLSHDVGLNAIRVPFAASALLSALQPPLCSDVRMLSRFNERYSKLSYLGQLKQFIQEVRLSILMMSEVVTCLWVSAATPWWCQCLLWKALETVVSSLSAVLCAPCQRCFVLRVRGVAHL